MLHASVQTLRLNAIRRLLWRALSMKERVKDKPAPSAVTTTGEDSWDDLPALYAQLSSDPERISADLTRWTQQQLYVVRTRVCPGITRRRRRILIFRPSRCDGLGDRHRVPHLRRAAGDGKMLIHHFRRSDVFAAGHCITDKQASSPWDGCPHFYWYNQCLYWQYVDTSHSGPHLVLVDYRTAAQHPSRRQAIHLHLEPLSGGVCLRKDVLVWQSAEPQYFCDTFLHSWYFCAESSNGKCYDTNKNLSYRQQIVRKLRTQYAEGIYRHKYYTVTLKSKLRVTQDHWKRNHWIDHTRLSSSRVIWRWILLWP